MKTMPYRIRRMMAAGMTAPALIALAAMLFLPSCEGGPGLFQPNRTWVATEPVQCLGNPWEMDWLASHANDFGSYPHDIASQNAIIRAYYARLGVEVNEIVSVHKYDVVCLACSCPRGDVLYLSVRDRDAATMLGFGYRLESPYGEGPCDSILPGRYSYTGYDSTGQPLITGTITFSSVDTQSVRGSWVLEGPGGYGPQIGGGTLEGWIDGNVLTVNLNPGWADNNVFLHGEVANGVYSGKWFWSTFVGPVYTGTFEAVKICRD